MRQRTRLFQGVILVLIIFTIYHPTAISKGYWAFYYFDTPEGSRIRIRCDTDHIDWEVSRLYSLSINVTALIVAANVKLSDVTVELKWTADNTKVIEIPRGPYEFVSSNDEIQLTYDFSPSRADYGVISGQSRTGILYLRVNATEDILNGPDSLWNTGWLEVFEVNINAPEGVNQMLAAAIIFLAAFGFLAIIGVRRQQE